jgi:hypothetical protein
MFKELPCRLILNLVELLSVGILETIYSKLHRADQHGVSSIYSVPEKVGSGRPRNLDEFGGEIVLLNMLVSSSDFIDNHVVIFDTGDVFKELEIGRVLWTVRRLLADTTANVSDRERTSGVLIPVFTHSGRTSELSVR